MEHKETKIIFRERLDKLRNDKSNTEFAEFLGLSRQTVGFYLNGDRMPDAVSLAKIARACAVSTDYLLGLTDEATPDMDERAACEYLGLTAEAVRKWRYYIHPAAGMHSFLHDIIEAEYTKAKKRDIEWLTAIRKERGEWQREEVQDGEASS